MVIRKRYFLILFVFVFLINIMVVSATDTSDVLEMNGTVDGSISENLIPVVEVNYTAEELELIQQREIDYENGIKNPWAGMEGIPEINEKDIGEIQYSRSGIDTVLSDSGDVIRQGDTFCMYLKDVNNNAMSGMHIAITFTLDGNSKTYDVVTDYLGIGTIPINLVHRIYEVKYQFLGISGYNGCVNNIRLLVYNDSFINTTLVVNPTSNMIIGEYLIANLTDVNNNLLHGKLLETNFTNNYMGLTTNYGIAHTQINYATGIYSFNCEYRGDNTYNPSRVNRTISISNTGKLISTVTSAYADTIFKGNSLIFRLNTTPSNYIPYKNIKVVFGSGGSVAYNIFSNNYGDANIQVNFPPGTYSITYFFEGDSQYAAFAKTTPLYVYNSSNYFQINNINQVNNLTLTAELYNCTSPQPYCNSDNPILISQAISITSNCNSVLEKVTAIQNWVKTHITYQLYYGTNRDAYQVYIDGIGNCVDQSYLVNAFCRAIGIPTRFQVIIWPNQEGHCFSQVLIGGVWVIADTIQSSYTLGNVPWANYYYTVSGIGYFYWNDTVEPHWGHLY